MEPKSPENDEKSPNGSEHEVAKFFLAVLAIVIAMTWSAYYKGPSAQSFDTEDFILFWLKELLLLVFAVIALVFGCIGWLRRRNQKHQGGHHAP